MDYRERWELKDYLRGRTLERRIRLFQLALILILAGFALDFWYLQGVRGEDYSDLAENNRIRRIPKAPTRGVIFDRRQQVLASTRPSLDLVLLRETGADLEQQLRRLTPILGVSFEALMERKALLEDLPPYAPMVLTEDVELEQLARIEARRELFPSVEVRQSARRSYPQRYLFGHLLGYVGEVSEVELDRGNGSLRLGDIVGKTGLERGYDDLLRGTRGWNLVSVNNLGRRIGDAWVGQEPVHGDDIRLTVDLRLQDALMQALDGEVGAGVFLDPWTGELLALGSTPAFDPNLFADGMTSEEWRHIAEDPRRPLLARAIASKYAPGSVFKVLMAVTGLETAAVDVDEVVNCTGSVQVYGGRRLCWKRGGHGRVDLRKALAHSCNVYFYTLGKKVGIDPIHEYGAMFGLGEATGIDLPGEATGLLPSREWKRRNYREPWYPGDTISIAIGQGLLALTPIQAARMMAAVATGGTLVRPHLIKGTGPEPSQVPVAPGTFRVIQDALRLAVEQGTGTQADVEGFPVAGKTGTAQVYKHSAGIDSDELPKQERDHAWFVGYAPAGRPRIAFAVIIEHGGHGGSAAAPVARAVLEVFFTETAQEMQRAARGVRAARSHVEAPTAR